MSRTYTVPRHTNATELRKEAQARRVALRQAGLTTYQLGRRGNGPAIMCLCCGLGSFHLKDIKERYCGFCDAFHDDVPAAAPKEPAFVDIRHELEDASDDLDKLEDRLDDAEQRHPAGAPEIKELEAEREELLDQIEEITRRLNNTTIPLTFEFASFHQPPPESSLILLLILHAFDECEWHIDFVQDGKIIDPLQRTPTWTFDDAIKKEWRWAELPYFLDLEGATPDE